MYLTICAHHKLCNNDENKSLFSQNVYAISNRIWCNKHLGHTTKEIYNNNGKGGYFWFDDNNMRYRKIISITSTEMGQLNTYNPIYFNEIKRQSIGLAAC